MADDLKAVVSGGGRQRRILIGVAVVAAGYVGYRWWVSRSTSSSSDVPVTGDVGAPVDASGVVGAGGVSGNVQYAGTTQDTRGEPRPGNFANDAEWTQYAAEKLSAGGRPLDLIYSALGDYLAGRGLDDTEATIVTSALGVAGDPPSGHKPIIKQVGEVTLAAPSGLHATGVGRTSVDLAWNKVDGAVTYFVYRDTIGSNVGATTQLSKRVDGLTPGAKHTFRVLASTATGKNGPKSGAITVTTKK